MSGTCSICSLSPEKGKGKPVVVFIHGGGFAARLEARAQLAVLRQRRAVGRGARARRRHHQLSPGAAVSVSRRRRGPHAAVALAAGAHRRNTAATRRRFSCGVTPRAPRTPGTISRMPRTPARSRASPAPSSRRASTSCRDTVSVWKAYYGEDVSKYKERSSLARSHEELRAAARGRMRSSTPTPSSRSPTSWPTRARRRASRCSA